METSVEPDAPNLDPANIADVDLTDPRLYGSDRPEQVWRAMRRYGQPIRSSGFRTHWAITRHQQIRAVLKRGRSLSSARGFHLGEKATDAVASAAYGGTSMLVSDDPVHAEMRRALESAFSRRRLDWLGARASTLAQELITRAVEAGSVEFVSEVSAPLPAIVASELIGVPPDDRDYVVQLAHQAFSGSGHIASAVQSSAHVELLQYCSELISAKRTGEGDDVASILAHATMFDQPMRHDIAVMNCHDLILGANTSSRHILSATALTMANQPEFWSALRARPNTIATAVEELVRYCGPANHVMRLLLDDVQIGSVWMRKGEFVSLWLRSANFDDEVFSSPERLVVDRAPNPHLGFGLGSHYCIGANLTRIVVRAVVHAMLRYVDSAAVCGAVTFVESSLLRGLRSVPLALTPRDPGRRSGRGPGRDA